VTRIIVTTMPDSRFISYLLDRLPTLEVVEDTKRDAWDTYMRSLEVQGDDPAIHMEDDILLTRDFAAKAQAVIDKRPDSVIQFFSMRGKDLTVGSRWDRQFAMNQCTYLPAGYPAAFMPFAESWTRRAENPYGYDTCFNDWLRSRREPYWISVPSLVEHRVAVSRIARSRSSRRQSKTFTDLDEE